MKKKLLSLLCLALAAVLLFAGCQSAVEEPEPTPESATYTATAAGFGGDVTVTLVADGSGVITAVTVEGANETPGFGADAIERFNKELAALVGSDAASAQLSVDAVSGATATSNAVLSALASISTQISGQSVQAELTDGVYTASAWGFGLTRPLSVETTIEGGRITAIVPDVENSDETDQIIQTAIDRMIPRIIDEQSLAVDAVSGATSSSNAIKSAVRDALSQSMAQSGMTEADISSAINQFYAQPSYLKDGAAAVEKTVDVVVVGAGGTGCLAALEAANMGADTLVIETSARYGGTSALTCGPMVVNSPEQVAANGGVDLVDEDLLFATWFEDARTQPGDTKATLITEYSELSGYTVDWMEKMGFAKFDQSITFKFPQFRVWSMYPGWNAGRVHGGGMTHDYFNALMETYTELGGKTMFETTGTELIVENGEVLGVRAVGYDGQVYDLYAKAVVLATGGYGGNEEMLLEYTKSDEVGAYQLYGVATNVGTAITMGQQVDAKLADNIDVVMAHFSAPTVRIHLFDTVYNQVPTAFAVNENALDVNTAGDRFINEVNAAADAGDETARYFAVYGGDAVEAIKQSGFTGTTAGMYMNPGAFDPGTPLPELDKVIDAGVELGFIFKADTVEDLAKAISEKTGASMENLAETVQAYNELCAEGTDSQFGKPSQYLTPVTGGYYIAVEASPIIYSTCSSLEVDTEMRVVTNAGAAIPNLFAGGTDTMGMLLYDEYTDYGGCAQAWAFTSGRIAGANAALYALNAEDVTDSTSAAAAGALNSLVNTGLEIARINDTTFRLYGSAPYLPALCGALGDDPANGVNYAVLQLDAPEGAASATLVSTQLLNGGFDAVPYGRTTPVEDGKVLLPVQLNTLANAYNGLALTVAYDDGTEAAYTLYADLVTMADEVLDGTDVTAKGAEAAQLTGTTKDVACVNLGLSVLRAETADGGAIFTLTGTLPQLPEMTQALGLEGDGDYYAAIFLSAPANFSGRSATLTSAAPYGQEAEASGERLEVVTLESGETGVVYLQRFVPGTTLAQGGTELTVDWNGTAVTYDLLYNSMSLGTMITDMSAALEDAGAANSGVTIVATGENTWTVSGDMPDDGVLNVLLEAPDPAAAYATVSVGGSVTEAPASRLLSTITAAPGDTVTVEAVWTAPASFWSGPVDYPVTYTFVVE